MIGGLRTSVIVVCALFAVVASAASQTLEKIRTSADFVVGTCYRALDDVSRVGSLARTLKWQELTADQANVFKPTDPQAVFQGWIAFEKDMGFMVGTSVGKGVTGKIQVCSVVADQRPDEIIPAVLQTFRSNRLTERVQDGGQIDETYRIAHPTLPKLILRVVRAVANEGPVSFAFVSIE